jgi:hypothetical protein
MVAAPLGRACGAQAIGVEQVIDLVSAAKRITYGSPQTVSLSIGGSSVAFTVSVSVLGAITAVPVAANPAVKQISIAVTTTGTGVAPSAVTVITGEGQVIGYRVACGADGQVLALHEGGPVSELPLHVAPADGGGQGGGHDAGAGSGTSDDGRKDHGPSSDLVDDKPPLSPGTPSPGGGIPYAPGTSPTSQLVSPH